MKLVCTEFSPSGKRTWLCLGDQALLRNNDDFYRPDFAGELACVPQWVYRIGKVGKSISPRFADRYIDRIGIGIRFYADDLIRELTAAGLPPDAGMGFNQAAALSPQWLDPSAAGDDPEYVLYVNNCEVARGRTGTLEIPPAQLLSEASAYYMMKVGDYFYTGGITRISGLLIGDRLRMTLNGQELLDFYIR